MSSIKEKIELNSRLSKWMYIWSLIFTGLVLADVVLLLYTSNLLFGILTMVCLVLSFLFRVFKIRYEKKEAELYKELRENLKK